MAKQTLPTNFKDDILNSSMGGKRRYKQTTNADGTVSLEDASTYDQVGSNFGASQLNAISKAVNQSADSSKIISDPDTASATTKQGYIADVQLFNHLNDSLGGIKFGVDKNGNYGYIKAGADSVTPFKSGINDYTVNANVAGTNFVHGQTLNVSSFTKLTITTLSVSSTENPLIAIISKDGGTSSTLNIQTLKSYEISLEGVSTLSLQFGTSSGQWNDFKARLVFS